MAVPIRQGRTAKSNEGLPMPRMRSPPA
jgi:hypothetical protein